MSINITVAKNQFGGHRRTVLSDLEQLKKSERERRKRLRLEQVIYFIQKFYTVHFK